MHPIICTSVLPEDSNLASTPLVSSDSPLKVPSANESISSSASNNPSDTISFAEPKKGKHTAEDLVSYKRGSFNENVTVTTPEDQVFRFPPPS